MIEKLPSEEKPLDPTKSLYDQSRDTVGKIYRDANLNNHETYIEVGDMSRELTSSLVEDINDAIKNFDKKEVPYYLMVHESKDLQMKTAIRRRILYFTKRPWPEDDTVVFWKDPKTQDLRFCWCLPHWSEMDNILQNPSDYEQEYVAQIKAWKAFDLKIFGFMEEFKSWWDLFLSPRRFFDKSPKKWVPNPKWKDKPIDAYKKSTH